MEDLRDFQRLTFPCTALGQSSCVRSTVMEGVDCVDHQLEETVSKVRARVQDRNTGGGPETFFVLATAPFLLSHQVLASQKIILRIQVIPPILWSGLRCLCHFLKDTI